MKPEILCIFDTCKDANDFLGDLAHDLNEMGVPIFDCCRQRLVLETEEYILWCIHMNSHNSFAKIFSNVKYLVNCSVIYKSKKVFREKVAFRLKTDIKEIKNRRELIKLMAGMQFDEILNIIEKHNRP